MEFSDVLRDCWNGLNWPGKVFFFTPIVFLTLCFIALISVADFFGVLINKEECW